MTKVFWLEPTTRYAQELRRYAGEAACPAKPYGMPCHDARIRLADVVAEEAPTCYRPSASDDPDAWKRDEITKDDPRWPATCVCGYRFTDEDSWQVNFDQLHEARGGAHDGEVFTLRDAPVGAMWDATWLHDWEGFRGPDGLCLVVKTPGGDWHVDGEASNCTRTQYEPVENGKRWTGRTHYCWVRHGDPLTGNLHVDKAGETCAAGAGSILCGGFHGFLHHGHLTPC